MIGIRDAALGGHVPAFRKCVIDEPGRRRKAGRKQPRRLQSAEGSGRALG